MPLTELDKLEEWAVNLINDYETSGDFGRSEPKRINRFSGELVANPEAYGELLDMARSQDMSAKEILSSIRSIENQLLDEASRGTKTSRKQLLSDVIHHFYAQRTGGDTLRRLGQADRKEVRNILREQFGKWGNVNDNLITLFRSWHGNWEKAKGLEAQALLEMGIDPDEAGKLPTIKAHQTSASSPLISGTAKGDTVPDALETIIPQMELQQRETSAAIEQAQPIRDALTEHAGGTGNTTAMSHAELARQRAYLQASPETPNLLRRGMQAVLENSKGVARITPRIGPGLIIGGSLAAVGALSDVSASATGTQQLLKPQSKPKTTASLLDVASGVTGLATLTPLAPVAAPMSVVLGLTGGAMRTRIQRDERLERDAAIMAGDIQPVQPDPYQTTITKPTKRRMGRQAAKRRQEAY
tara:strand:+ start:40 stop:1284 length:1245 start_codon:yes stop_codon:yes gene_type:complete